MAPLPDLSGDVRDAAAVPVPDIQLVGVDHPCIVKSLARGLQSLGGEQQLKHVFEGEHNSQRRATKRVGDGPLVALSFRPDDPLDAKLESTPAPTNNVLVKIALPKWTGRKRKRGSNEPFAAHTPTAGHLLSAPDLLRRLQDNAEQYHVEVVGQSETSHRFEALPDLRIHEQDVPIMREMRQHATKPKYDTLKDFHIDLAPGSQTDATLPRPGAFIPPGFDADDPFEILPDVPQVTRPQVPREKKPTLDRPDSEIPPKLKSLVDSMRAYMEHRPIATRLALLHAFSDAQPARVDAASTWAGARPKDGLFKDCIVKHGIDPQSDPKYRIYQLVSVRPHNTKASKDDSGSPFFDGVTPTRPRSYQYCDLTDPVLASIVNTPSFRTAEEGYGSHACGWYYNGTIAKIKVIMSDKLKHLIGFNTATDEEGYMALAALPDSIDADTDCKIDPGRFGSETKSLAVAIKKEAVRLLSAGTRGLRGSANAAGVGGQGGEDAAAGEEEDREDHDGDDDPAMAIDPTLLAEDEDSIGGRDGNPLYPGATPKANGRGGQGDSCSADAEVGLEQ